MPQIPLGSIPRRFGLDAGGVLRQLALLTVVAGTAAYARTAVSPLQESMRSALALSDNQMALLQGPALALPVVALAVPLGFAIDRSSRVRLLFGFALLDAFGNGLTALTSNFAVLFTARCLIGFAVTGSSMTAFSVLADLYAPAQRGRATMVVVVGQYAGMAAAFAAGGALLGRVAAGPNTWRWALLESSVPLALGIFAALAMREPPRSGRVIENPSVRDSWLELWRYRFAIVPLLCGLVFAEMAVLAVLIWGAPALSRSFGLGPERVGAIMAMVVFASGVVGAIAGGVLADLCQRAGGPRRTLMALSVLALGCLPVSLFALAPGIGTASTLLILFMTLVGTEIVTGNTLFIIVVPNELRGLCMGTLSLAGVLFAIGLAPMIVSGLSGVLGGSAMLGKALSVLCMTACALGAIAFVYGLRIYSAGALPSHASATHSPRLGA